MTAEDGYVNHLPFEAFIDRLPARRLAQALPVIVETEHVGRKRKPFRRAASLPHDVAATVEAANEPRLLQKRESLTDRSAGGGEQAGDRPFQQQGSPGQPSLGD